MARCEMCGREAELVKAEIEGGELKVCYGCAKYGKIKQESVHRVLPQSKKPVGSASKHERPSFRIVKDCSSLIRTAREKREMSQEDFAKFLNERESIVAKWEQGSLRPRIDTARRLERKLGIRLVEKEEETSEDVDVPKVKKDEFTLGDFIKVRKRKS